MVHFQSEVLSGEGAVAALAFDWLGRNLYWAERGAGAIHLMRVDGKSKHRAVLLANDGNRTSVARPKGLCLDPTDG